MVEGWNRVCPQCGNTDGAKVERIAFHPTFQCACGYVWDGSGATFLGVWKVQRPPTKEDLDAFADRIFESIVAARRDAEPDERMSQ